jgi:hypothetical protein
LATTRKGRIRKMKMGVKSTPRQISRTRPTRASTTATGSSSTLSNKINVIKEDGGKEYTQTDQQD